MPVCLPPLLPQELKAKEQIAQLKQEISSLTKLLEQVGGGGRTGRCAACIGDAADGWCQVELRHLREMHALRILPPCATMPWLPLKASAPHV